MEMNKGAAIDVLLDQVAATGGTPQLKAYLVELLGDYPVFTAVGKGEATLGDINLIRQIGQRHTSPLTADARDMVIRALLDQVETLSRTAGENPLASSAYRAGISLVKSPENATQALKALFTQVSLSWRPTVVSNAETVPGGHAWQSGGLHRQSAAVQPTLKVVSGGAGG